MLTIMISDKTVSYRSAEDWSTFNYIQHLSLQKNHILFEDFLPVMQSKAPFSIQGSYRQALPTFLFNPFFSWVA